MEEDNAELNAVTQQINALTNQINQQRSTLSQSDQKYDEIRIRFD